MSELYTRRPLSDKSGKAIVVDTFGGMEKVNGDRIRVFSSDAMTQSYPNTIIEPKGEK